MQLLDILHKIGSVNSPIAFTCFNLYHFTAMSFVDVRYDDTYAFIYNTNSVHNQCIFSTSTYFMLVCQPLLQAVTRGA